MRCWLTSHYSPSRYAAGSETASPSSTDVQANVEADSSRSLPSDLDESTIAQVRELPSRSTPANVIYLTADSPNEVATLEEGATYVIGGIVDKNRYKVRGSASQIF